MSVPATHWFSFPHVPRSSFAVPAQKFKVQLAGMLSPEVWVPTLWTLLSYSVSWNLFWIPEVTAPGRLCPLLRGLFSSCGWPLPPNLTGTGDRNPQTSGCLDPISVGPLPQDSKSHPPQLFVSTAPREVTAPCSFYLCDSFLWNFIV